MPTTAAHIIRPIHNERDYQAALRQVERLFDAEPGTPEGDELEILTILIEVYEAEHYPMDELDPIAAILFRLEQQGLARKDLEDCIGSSGRVSEVLSKKRPLSKGMILALHKKLGIPLDLLMRPSKRRKRK
jgi:HTH-type transcriptional regulator/antitoxin HigA